MVFCQIFCEFTAFAALPQLALGEDREDWAGSRVQGSRVQLSERFSGPGQNRSTNPPRHESLCNVVGSSEDIQISCILCDYVYIFFFSALLNEDYFEYL